METGRPKPHSYQKIICNVITGSLKNFQMYWSLKESPLPKYFFEALKLAVEFVTAAANIRASSFGIPLHSLFEASVMHPSRKMLLMPIVPFEPNRSCYDCHTSLTILLFTVHGSSLLYEVGDDLEEDMVANYSINLEKVPASPETEDEFDDEEEPDGMVLSGWTPSLALENNNKTSVNNGASTSGLSQEPPETVEDDEVEIVLAPGLNDVGGKKRKLSDVSETCRSGNKTKSDEPHEDCDIVVMLEDGNPDDANKKKRVL
ncbi:hypothetical protein Leryth_020865 [Lithospermum erythrorhizon]|nr:hypothetical protein Leryth_020865 [Lithospermum erythrorhizon]